jgi:hypothetical protein
MAKITNPTTAVKIRACYNSIPAQLAKENVKFQYKSVQRGGTATIFGESIKWFVYDGIALKCQKTSHGFMPVSAYADLSDFKLYLSDAGMLTMKSHLIFPDCRSIEVSTTPLPYFQTLFCNRDKGSL